MKFLSLCHIPFLSPDTSLQVLSGHFLSSSSFSQCLSLGLPQFLGHGNNLPWSAVGSPCKAQQGPAWSPTLAQARLSKEDSNHHRKHSYHSAHDSPLSFLHILSIYHTIISLSKGTWALDKRNWIKWLLGIVEVNLYMRENILRQCFLRKLQ